MRFLRNSLIVLSMVISSSLSAGDPEKIYPMAPLEKSILHEKILKLTESNSPVTNVYVMSRLKLESGLPKERPWGGSFWPLIQGQIANPWMEKSYTEFWEYLGWKGNVKDWKKRRQDKLSRISELTEKDLSELAPSEKYELLLGDTSFTLTSNIWNFVERWGQEKKWGFLSSIDIPEGYRLPKSSKFIALWEGICHGWALAAGTYPRPEKTVNIKLVDGRNLPFYPHDIKALVSLFYANSNLQDNVLVEGFRCNEKNPARDKFGRFIDRIPGMENEAHLPRCADVHPAVWHIGMVNLTGVQKRSFVVEIDADAPINNFPFSGYEYKWFNPESGKYGSVESSVVSLQKYKDPYKDSRHPTATHLVGVDTRIFYTAWETPAGTEDDSPEKDKIKDQSFMYDLELDKAGNIVGGQWRAERIVVEYENIKDAPKIKQPDFFWVAPLDYKKHLGSLDLEKWDGKGSVPKSWQAPARNAHNFIYQVTKEYGFNEKCTVIEKSGSASKEVDCEFRYPRPQPLLNIVEKLVEMSRE